MKPLHELEIRVTQNTAGRWGYIVELGKDARGKRIQKTSFRYDLKREAIAAGNEWLDEYRLNQGNIKTGKDMIVNDYIPHYLEVYSMDKTKKPSAVKSRKNMMHRIRQHFGDCYVSRIEEKEIQEMIDQMQKESLSQTYIDSVYVTLKLILQLAIKEGLRTTNPTLDIKTRRPAHLDKDKYVQKLPVYMELEELKELLEKAREQLDYRFYAAFYLMGHTGMRPGEALALKWSDIDFEKSTLLIYKTLFWHNDRIGDYELLHAKSEASYRRIDLFDGTVDVLEELRERQQEERRKAWRWHDADFVFTNTVNSGYPIKQRALSYHLTNVMKNVSFKKDITPHKFRHTHISLLGQAGVPIEVIMDRVGHADRNVTMGIYMHVTQHRKRDAQAAYQKMLNSCENQGNE